MIALSCSPSAGFYAVFATSGRPGWASGVSPWRAADIPSSPPAEPDDPTEPDSPGPPENPDFPPDDVPLEIDDPPPDALPEPVREPPVMPKPSRRADIGSPGAGTSIAGCSHGHPLRDSSDSLLPSRSIK